MNVGTWLFKRSLVSSDRPAIVFDDQVLTYRQMNRRVNRLSHAMIKMGLSKGDRAGVLSRNCPEFLEIYFSCAKTGIIFVPMNFRLAPPEIAYQINDSDLSLLFFDPELESIVEDSKELLSIKAPAYVSLGSKAESWFSGYEAFIESELDTEPPVPEAGFTLDAAQIIMYTSGTTGELEIILWSRSWK